MRLELRKFVCLFVVVLCTSHLAFADWNEGEAYKMHFPQLPDPMGWDVRANEPELADDFMCTESGLISDIHIWYSVFGDEYSALLQGGVVRIYADVPAGTGGINYSRPGAKLWEWVFGQNDLVIRRYATGEQGWYDPREGVVLPNNHYQIWQLNLTNIPEPFTQTEGQIYWLAVQFNATFAMGWKTSLNHWNDIAVWRNALGAQWQPLEDPLTGAPLDFAFIITGGPVVSLDFGDAPDNAAAPGYPTLLPNGARHTIVAGMFLGGSVDAEADGQPTANADGDDLNPLAVPDDEDGVTFAATLIPGQAATVNVVASVPGILDAWVDFNIDGSWMEAGDQIAPSVPLVVGNNPITFNVPATATPGTTYARFRFSSIGGLTPSGLAPDGEVEDYTVTIERETPDPNVKYIQYPDLTPRGIDIRVDESDGVVRHIADDFNCTQTGPITDVHFWGSWEDDDKGQIGSIEVKIYSDDPVGAGGTYPDNQYSMPDELLWQHKFYDGQFVESLYYDLGEEFEWWWDPYFGDLKQNGDHQVWKYDIYIDPADAFIQQGTPDNPLIYWLELRVNKAYNPDANGFGWKTSTEHWNDDAVFANGAIYPWVSGWSELRYPPGHPYSPESLDMAFAITTGAEPNIPEDPNLKYLQPPDTTEMGIDVRFDRSDGIMRTLADDFPCTSKGRITDVHLWCSWFNDIKGDVEKIHLSIHKDIPASQSPTGYSMPGALLWERDCTPADFNETLAYTLPQGQHEWWWDPYMAIPANWLGDTQIWRYDIDIPWDDAFEQQGEPNTPLVYWLDAYAIVNDPTGGEAMMGWKTSTKHWN
ncbi:MAG: GEVED domain-containing protein, partial [Phycisphaerae bacterium]|nr:GEVED domain-containing protein [Phycisphaerae bacterium]